jgi:hypothetical protein
MTESDEASIAQARVRYGTTHPEWVRNDLWEQSIREGWTAYGLRKHLGFEFSGGPRDFADSGYRESTAAPFFSWERFGRTSTPLPDGRVVHIAGEHEDYYDPDFCIYNDVIVEYAGGRREFYLYPKDVFPPTDFHTATLIGHEILLIGSLGYRDLRRPGETQVLKLDTRTLRIDPVPTAGEGPGWISRHLAERLGEASILVAGGDVQTAKALEPNAGIFELDLTSMTWRRRAHGDTTLFPVAPEVYRRARNPRYGSSNPERSDNPFWQEMVRRQWLPSRARLHFGDAPPPRPRWKEDGSHNLKRSIDDVVWTSEREDALDLTLADGRRLRIGGVITDYGDNYADPWIYNDVIVTHTDGTVEILTYPLAVFPSLFWPATAASVGEQVYLCSRLDWRQNDDRSRAPVMLRLNTSTYEIVPVPVPDVALPIAMGLGVQDGNRVVFPIQRMQRSDPRLSIALDLTTLTWSEPFLRPHPGDD